MKKKSIEEVSASFENEGYQLLTTEYKNNKQRLEFVCPKGHNHSISYIKWNLGQRCGKCIPNLKISYEEVKQSFESKGYQLLTTEYINNTQKLEYICPNGHRYTITYDKWRSGQRCGKCHYHSINDIYLLFKYEGYQLLSTNYINCECKLDFICTKGHKHFISWSSWQQGHRCGKCSSSKPEMQLLNYIKFVYPHLNIIHQDRTTIFNPSTGRGLEFDVWLPELNKAIEMDGVNVHYGGWNKTNDSLKNQLCEEKGIPLLRVTDEEWYTSSEVRSKIHRFINQ